MSNFSESAMVRSEGIVKNYISGAETLYILKGITFEIKKGLSAAVSGQSGSGKSTLLNILGGLERADEGKVFIAGSQITGIPEKDLAHYRSKQVGFIFQFHYLLKDFTALENVMLPAYIAGLKKKTALEKARALLSDVRLDDRIGHYPSQLSGGERQRVAVARSMVNDPDIILADEPTGNLDADNSAMVAELLYSNAEKWGKTLIVVTHDEKVAARASIHFTLKNGLLSCSGAEEGILPAPETSPAQADLPVAAQPSQEASPVQEDFPVAEEPSQEVSPAQEDFPDPADSPEQTNVTVQDLPDAEPEGSSN